jgi:hypothetical protein
MSTVEIGDRFISPAYFDTWEFAAPVCAQALPNRSGGDWRLNSHDEVAARPLKSDSECVLWSFKVDFEYPPKIIKFHSFEFYTPTKNDSKTFPTIMRPDAAWPQQLCSFPYKPRTQHVFCHATSDRRISYLIDNS